MKGSAKIKKICRSVPLKNTNSNSVQRAPPQTIVIVIIFLIDMDKIWQSLFEIFVSAVVTKTSSVCVYLFYKQYLVIVHLYLPRM